MRAYDIVNDRVSSSFHRTASLSTKANIYCSTREAVGFHWASFVPRRLGTASAGYRETRPTGVEESKPFTYLLHGQGTFFEPLLQHLSKLWVVLDQPIDEIVIF